MYTIFCNQSSQVSRGFCHHIAGLLFQLSHCKMLGLNAIPPVLSKTSKPQTWHIPRRIDGLALRQADEVVVSKIKAPVEGEDVAEKKRKTGVISTVFKPFEALMSSLNLPKVLTPLFSGITPSPGYLRIWPDENENPELVDSKYGPVPKGSVLSYQQCKPKPSKT